MSDHKQSIVNIKAPPYAESEYCIYSRVHFIVLMASMLHLAQGLCIGVTLIQKFKRTKNVLKDFYGSFKWKLAKTLKIFLSSFNYYINPLKLLCGIKFFNILISCSYLRDTKPHLKLKRWTIWLKIIVFLESHHQLFLISVELLSPGVLTGLNLLYLPYFSIP